MDWKILVEQIFAQILPAYFGSVIIAAYILGGVLGLRSWAGKWFIFVVIGFATVTGILFYWLDFIPGSQPGQYFFTWLATIGLYEVILKFIFPTWKAEKTMKLPMLKSAEERGGEE